MPKTDHTFDSVSLYGSVAWTARRLGMSKDTFFRRRDDLVKNGFPTQDPLTRAYLKSDVDAWVENRKKITATIAVRASTSGVNFDAI